MDAQQYIQLGLAGVALFFMYKIVGRVMDTNEKLALSIDKNTEVTGQLKDSTDELYTYVKTRNGTLERLVRGSPRVKEAARAALDS